MLNSVDFSGKPFHFIGIGGIGMSALAHILLSRKLPVSGSDLRLNPITERLQAMGAHIFSEQTAANLEYFKVPQKVPQLATAGAGRLSSEPPLLPQVICSTAINTTNPEYRAALDMGCPIFHRSDILAGLICQYQSISVAGTHGKTTTSSMIGHMLLEAGLDPTVIIGGEVPSLCGNARAGNSEYLVAEADESDGSLVKFLSYIGVVTNIELDHPDHYSDLDAVVEIFQQFAQRCQRVIGSIDCPVVREQLRPSLSYSLDRFSGANYTVDQINLGATVTTARVWEGDQVLGVLKLPLLGPHNLSNALAAIAVGRCLGLPFVSIAAGLATFQGARRRFELRGEVNNIRLIDDYAHHPSEVQATLAAARLQANAENRRLVAVFQPHRFSRTLTFLPEFATSFANADVVVVSDIYSAGETNSGKISGEQVAETLAKHHHEVHYQPTLSSLRDYLRQILQPGDLAVFLSAGNLNQVIPELMAAQPG